MRSDCRICHGTNLELRLKLADSPIGDEFLSVQKHQPLHPIELYQCADCGLAQLLYEIPPEEIYKDYIYLTGSSVGLQEHFRRYAFSVWRTCGLRDGDLVVDIGSNDGTLLKYFKRYGMDVLGVEPCEAIADDARRSGIPTVNAYFKPGLMQGKAKVITANNVVANINDLDTFMQGVTELLADDGTFVFESFYLGDVINNMVFDFIYHEHLSAFSIRPVKRLMERYGLALYKVEHLPTKGGSIRYYCNRYYAGRAMPDVPDGHEKELYEKDTWIKFNVRIINERRKTRRFCSEAKAAGKRIAGFGACISGTTLMYHFGLGEFLDCLVDENPAKLGTYSPGQHLLVEHPDKLADLKPDYVLALAWRFADDFRAKYPNVPLIVPLPEHKIYG